MAPGEQIFPEDLPANLRGNDNGSSNGEAWSEALQSWTRKALFRGQTDVMAEARGELEKVILDCALDFTDGKRVEAARLLGLGRNTLTRKLKEFEQNS